MTPAKGSNDVYKTVSMCLASALLTLAGAYFTMSRNAVSRDEMPALVQQNNPYVQDAKDIKAKLDDLGEYSLDTTMYLYHNVYRRDRAKVNCIQYLVLSDIRGAPQIAIKYADLRNCG